MLPSIFGENLFDDFYDDGFLNTFGSHNPLFGKHSKNMMKTDVRETDSTYEIDVDLPGFKKDEINVNLEDGYLTVSAEKGLDEEDRERGTGRYIRRERYAGSCERTFYVGDEVKREDIKGEFKHGILKLFIPKKEARPAAEQKKYITIE